jgi:hypothetical protein
MVLDSSTHGYRARCFPLFLNDSYGHQVRIRCSDFYDRFQIAAIPDSDQIGKFRHIEAIHVNQEN